MSLGATILNLKDNNNEEEEALNGKLKKLESVIDPILAILIIIGNTNLLGL